MAKQTFSGNTSLAHFSPGWTRIPERIDISPQNFSLSAFHHIQDALGVLIGEGAERIVENCAHPTYRPLLRRYLELSKGGHSPHALKYAFALHTAYRQTGSMLNAKL